MQNLLLESLLRTDAAARLWCAARPPAPSSCVCNGYSDFSVQSHAQACDLGGQLSREGGKEAFSCALFNGMNTVPYTAPLDGLLLWSARLRLPKIHVATYCSR